MPKLKVGHISTTLKEDAAINAGIAAAPESRELDSEWFSQAKPASKALPPETYATLIAKRPRGRPKADETKVFTAIRLDADLLDAFKSTGRGWQTRVNEALRHYLTDSAAKDVGITTMFRVKKNQLVFVSAHRNNSKGGVS